MAVDPTQNIWVEHQNCRKQEGNRRGPSQLIYFAFDHWSLYHVHGYDDSEDGQLELLSKTDQGMQGKHVRRDADAEVPLEDKHDTFARLKAGRLLVVVY